LASWWISIGVGFLGAALVSFALFQSYEKEAAVIELPDIVVPPDVPSPAPSPDLVESRPVMEEILEATPEPIPARPRRFRRKARAWMHC